ncbi:MAG TPA: TatD family hydrolase [Candidatus Saccharimonadales bacterium]|nr:TatD family hydrolase [Candidatus Saccharimonadales bacterium]
MPDQNLESQVSSEESRSAEVFTDTHCHIHEADYPETEAAFKRAGEAGVTRLICVGTDEKTSVEAVEFADTHNHVWASVGLHPHDAKSGVSAVAELEELIKTRQKVVAVGECGLDYFYDNSPRASQIDMLHAQLELAGKYDLAVIFHVREAFDDFWPIWREHKVRRAVLHSFTDSVANLEKAVQEGLFIGVNGISTFARDKQAMYAAIPAENLLLETDSPFLTPTPYRGKVNEPAYLTLVAKHIADLQSINLQELSAATERNATKLFFKTNS